MPRTKIREHPGSTRPGKLPPLRDGPPPGNRALIHTPEVVAAPDADNIDLLPGSSPYDKAFLAGVISYAEAKVRDELHTRREIANIEVERAKIDLEIKKTEAAKSNGALLSRAEYIERQNTLCSVFKEMLRMVVVDMGSSLPATTREQIVNRTQEKCDRALYNLATAVSKKQTTEQAMQSMFDGYNNA